MAILIEVYDKIYITKFNSSQDDKVVKGSRINFKSKGDKTPTIFMEDGKIQKWYLC